MNSYIEYSSQNDKFKLQIAEELLSAVLQVCAQEKGFEIGGILVGHYNERRDIAIITDYSKPPIDSKKGRNWFHRGIKGLKKWLHKLWRDKTYYLGEWHYHPFTSASYSMADRQQMLEIAQSDSYACPEPILLIIGGIPEYQWEARAYVFTKSGDVFEMFQSDPGVKH